MSGAFQANAFQTAFQTDVSETLVAASATIIVQVTSVGTVIVSVPSGATVIRSGASVPAQVTGVASGGAVIGSGPSVATRIS